MAIVPIKQQAAPSVSKRVEAKSVEATVETAAPVVAQKPSEGFDILKKKLMSVSGRYSAPKAEGSGRADLKELVSKQRSAAQAGSVAPARPATTDAGATAAMKELGAANTKPGSITGQEMTQAIRKGIKDLDHNAAAGEYQVISRWVRANAKLLSPGAKASFAAYEKLVTAAQAQGKTGLVANSFQGVGAKAPGDVEKLLAQSAKDPAVGDEIATVQTEIANGDFKKASAAMKKAVGNTDELSDEKPRKTVQNQLQFLANMQEAGVKEVSYPPTEAQLTDYFKTLKNDPSAARTALKDYMQSFHVHPADVPGAAADVEYSADKMVSRKVKGMKDIQDITTHVPESWSEVSNNSPKDENGHEVKLAPESVGKQVNDCEGFGFIAEKLLGAAGFKVEAHLTVHGGAMGDAGHAMVMFTHLPEEKDFTVTSNDGVFTDRNKKTAAKDGYTYAAPRKYDEKKDEYVPNVTGTEVFFRGDTMHDSQVAGQSKGAKL